MNAENSIGKLEFAIVACTREAVRNMEADLGRDLRENEVDTVIVDYRDPSRSKIAKMFGRKGKVPECFLLVTRSEEYSPKDKVYTVTFERLVRTIEGYIKVHSKVEEVADVD